MRHGAVFFCLRAAGAPEAPGGMKGWKPRMFGLLEDRGGRRVA